jgi:hypothetical protein
LLVISFWFLVRTTAQGREMVNTPRPHYIYLI